MKLIHWFPFALLSGSCLLTGCSHSSKKKELENIIPRNPREVHFESVRQLTFGGSNAEAYWSFDGNWLTFQHQGPGPLGDSPECDQIYKMRSDGTEVQRLSSGKGRTTCSFFLPRPNRILFSTTEATQPTCPPLPDYSEGYVWPIDPNYQIFGVKPDGTDPIPLEPAAPRAYNAEATVCRDGSVVFTSDRDGDLNLYRAQLDSFGTFHDIKKITETLGYDGGAVFSPDCSQIAWRASRPRPGKETEKYKRLLKEHRVQPTELEIWTARKDGSHARQVTRLGAASFAPTFSPDGSRILFSSNLNDPKSHEFNLYSIRLNGTGLKQITYSQTFDSFPMFSPDGNYLAFSSNRYAKNPHEINVFVAEWQSLVETTPVLASPDPADRFQAAVDLLSSPFFAGREVGEQGLEYAEDWLAEQFQKLQLKPLYFGLKIPIDIKSQQGKIVTTHNIVGTWGKGCQKTPPIVIGAHLDHLGMGSPESLEPTQSGLHPGADDNASGIAALLEIARMIQAQPQSKKHCYIFAGFSGEEVGIAGSSQMVKLLKHLKIQPKAMLNLDMVGRLENNTLLTFGTDSAKELKKIVNTECEAHRLTCKGGGDGYGPSDHMAFYLEKVPVIHFFTGPHLDYHRTSDTAEKINATGGVQVSEVVTSIALRLASPKQTLTFQKASSQPSLGLVHGEKKRSKGAYLGTIPDYASLTSPHGPAGGSAPGGGVKLAGVRPGSPADQAGVQAGDELISLDAQRVNTLQDFTHILSELTPGSSVILGIRRNGLILQLKAVVGKRGNSLQK